MTEKEWLGWDARDNTRIQSQTAGWIRAKAYSVEAPFSLYGDIEGSFCTNHMVALVCPSRGHIRHEALRKDRARRAGRASGGAIVRVVVWPWAGTANVCASTNATDAVAASRITSSRRITTAGAPDARSV